MNQDEIFKTNVWQLFKEEFTDGEQVIVVHENSKLYFGKLTAHEDYCLVGTNEFPWTEIIFIAHDGFPCRALHTCLSNEQLAETENADSILLMRKALSRKPNEKIITESHLQHIKPRHHFYSLGYGCPFEIQEAQMQILNPPNSFQTDFEETLLCKSKDGAIGMLWGLEEEVIKFYPN